MMQRDQSFELLCEEVREALSGMLEGDPRSCEDKAVARHLEHCPACLAYRTEIAALERSLREHLDHPVDSERIWARVTDAIAGEPVPPCGAARRRMASPEGRRNFLRLGAIAAVVLAAPIGALLWPIPMNQRQSFLAGAVEDFTDFLQGGGTLDVRASHPSLVRRWMQARVEFELPPGVSGPEGVQLAGARLCSILGRRLAFLAYRSGSRNTGLYVTPASGLGFSDSDRFSVTSRDGGLTTATWQHDGLAYVIVSNALLGEVEPFIAHFRRTGP